MVISALRSHDWVQTQAAESLGISERVLRYKMKKPELPRLENRRGIMAIESGGTGLWVVFCR